MKLSQKDASSTQRIIIYGPPKSGKTKLAGALAEIFNLLWFDLEKGHGTLKTLPIEWQERIELISLPDTRSYPIAIETCLKVIKGAKTSICEEHGKVSCPVCAKAGKPVTIVELSTLGPDTVVVFDSLTQLTNSAIAHITKGQPEDYKLEYDDWGNLGKLMDIFLSHIQQAGYNVVCISHETEAELEDGKTHKLVPVAGTRNFSRNVAKYFDTVIYCEVKNKRHVAYSSTTSANNLNTGSRAGITIDADATPSLLKFFPDTPASAAPPAPPAPIKLFDPSVPLSFEKVVEAKEARQQPPDTPEVKGATRSMTDILASLKKGTPK